MTERIARLGVLALCVALTGCGGGGGGEESVEVTISAATGGTVAVGGASLDIPAGALAADTTITATRADPSGDLPDQDTLRGQVVDFGPDGTTFLTPAMLSLPLDGTPGEGEEAVVSFFDGTSWVDLESTVSGGSISAPVEHFTFFIVRFRGAGPVDCSFSACGGDVVGTWNLQGVCFSPDGNNPLADSCPDATFVADLDGSGTATLNADMTFTFVLSIGGTATIGLPAECLSGASCAEIQSSLNGSTCSDRSGGGCDCDFVIDPAAETTTGTWSTSGTTISIVKDGETGGPDNSEYCISGSELKSQDDKGNVLTFSR